MGAMTSHFAGVMIIYSPACSGADQSKHQKSASLACMRVIHRWIPLPKAQSRGIFFPFYDVIMQLPRSITSIILNNAAVRQITEIQRNFQKQDMFKFINIVATDG